MISPSEQAYAVLLDVADDATAVAEEAIRRADQAESKLQQAKAAAKSTPPTQESITLTKVASSRYLEVAVALKETGSFPEFSDQALAKHLEKGATAQLEVLEKLASRAVFDMGSEIDLGGSLVEKSSTNRGTGYGNLTGETALWRKALDETDAELAGSPN